MNRYKKRKGAVMGAAAGLVLIVVLIGIIWGQRRSAAMVFFSELGPGWNLGNALDAHASDFSSQEMKDYEQQWGNPEITPALFAALYEGGFRTVRLPVTWYPHLDEQYKIDEAWMARVQQVVDMALDAGLHVILNVHHDDWYHPFEDNLDLAEGQLVIVWRQICAAFSDYDTRLIFEAMNEPRLKDTDDEWTEGTPEARAGINRLNAAFVKTVRGAGGENAVRYLLIPTYGAMAMPAITEALTLPKDDRLGVSVHVYLPTEFALEPEGTDQWSDQLASHTQVLGYALSDLHTTFIQQGIPVVITEYGALDKNNTQARIQWTSYLAQLARDWSISLVWWDNGVRAQGDTVGTFALLDRHSLTWHHPEIVSAITDSGA